MPSTTHDPLSLPSTSTSSWHQISPVTRPLNLEILEITSLTLTIALSLAPRPRGAIALLHQGSRYSQPSSHQKQDQQHLSQRASSNQLSGAFAANTAKQRKNAGRGKSHRSAESDDELIALEEYDGVSSPYHVSNGNGGESSSSSTPQQVTSSSSHLPGSYPSSDNINRTTSLSPSSAPSFKELLSKGVVVTVNGKPWSMIVAHVDEEDLYPHGNHLRSNPTEDDHRSSAVPNSSLIRQGSDTERLNLSSSSAAGEEEFPEARREVERAIVVIYGLAPGKEYEIDLKVIGNLSGGDIATGGSGGTASTSITTPSTHPHSSVIPSPHQSSTGNGTRSRANSLRNRPNGGGRSRSSSLIQQVATATTSGASIGGGRTPPDGSIAAVLGGVGVGAGSGGGEHGQTALSAHEEFDHSVSADDGISGARANREVTSPDEVRSIHLRHLLQTANGEKEDLTSQLKKSRRESQKAEASLRADIEALKKAMEKTILPDQRSRQKSLALQEQVKQALAGATEAEKEQRLIEQGMDHLEEQEGEVSEEWAQAKEERDKAALERDKIVDETRKAMAEEDAELASVTARLEKQVSKRDRILRENQDLQQKLEDVASARREVEKRNEAVLRQRRLMEDYPGVAKNHAHHGGRAEGMGSGPGTWDNDDVWTVNPSAASRPNGGRGSIAGPNAPTFIGQQGLGQSGMAQQQNGYSSSDLHGMGRPSGPSHNARPFWPGNANMPRGPSGPPSTPPIAAAALATQGIPKAATTGVSHLGNPTGFFPLAGSASSAAAALGRVYQARTTSGGSSGIGSTSPLAANVNAAPFMPSQAPSASIDITRQSNLLSDQHTSLVPPQLQHRIFLPSNRPRVPSSGQVPVATSPGSAFATKPNTTAGQSDSPQPSPTLAAPAFPPLPSTRLANPASSYKPSVGSGPSLASIVTRAIIPSNSVLHAQAGQQKSPVAQPADVQSQRQTIRPSPPTSSAPSAYGRMETGQDGSTGRFSSPPQQEVMEEFPPLPVSPSNTWAQAQSPFAAQQNRQTE